MKIQFWIGMRQKKYNLWAEQAHLIKVIIEMLLEVVVVVGGYADTFHVKHNLKY